MINKINNVYKNFEKITYKILKNGLIFCFCLIIFSVLLLSIYTLFFASPLLFYVGIGLFKLSLIFAIEFVICSFVVDGIKKEI